MLGLGLWGQSVVGAGFAPQERLVEATRAQVQTQTGKGNKMKIRVMVEAKFGVMVGETLGREIRGGLGQGLGLGLDRGLGLVLVLVLVNTE